MAKFNIAIDGTSGVGKSTIADLLADELGMVHLDTGAMYRCVALATKKHNVELTDESQIEAVLDQIEIQFKGDKVYLNGEDVSTAIRTNEISMLTSKVASLPIVREKMVPMQQKIAANGGYILDGRDICSTVLPDAKVKLFMSATSEARAKRRYDEYISKGVQADYQTILDDIIARDYQDSHRAISPLKKADDAIEVDTSHLNVDEVFHICLDIVKSKM